MRNILIVLALFSVSWAGDESINVQIEAIQHASPQERVAKMNRLKLQIANMNEEERLKALEQLQSSQSGSPQRTQLQYKQGMNNGGANLGQQYHLQQNNPTAPRRQGR